MTYQEKQNICAEFNAQRKIFRLVMMQDLKHVIENSVPDPSDKWFFRRMKAYPIFMVEYLCHHLKANTITYKTEEL